MRQCVCLALLIGSVLLVRTVPGWAADAKQPNVVGKIVKIDKDKRTEAGPAGDLITMDSGKTFFVMDKRKVKGELKVGCRIKAWVTLDNNLDEEVAYKAEVTDE